MHRATLTFVTLALLTACTASVTGKPYGTEFGAASSLVRRGSNSINSSYTVSIANRDVNCDEFGTDGGVGLPDGAQLLSIVVAKNGSELPLSRGEAYLQSGSSEYATVYGCQVAEGRCRLTAFSEASVWITNATDAKVAGRFEATYAPESKVTGSFDAALCP